MNTVGPNLGEILREQHGNVMKALGKEFDDAEVIIAAVTRRGDTQDSTAIGPALDKEAQKHLLAAILGGLRQAHGWSDQEIAGFIGEALYEADSFVYSADTPGRLGNYLN